MNFKTFFCLVVVSLFFIACSEDTEVTVPRNLQEYIDTISNEEFGEIIACAASANANTNLAYIFYYPEEGASNIRYYEADSLNVDPNVLANYRRQSLEIEDVFGGKLQRFTRSGAEENWCLVTYILDGKLHKSNPIRLKNTSKSTVWTDQVTIDYTTSLAPKFTWTDNAVGDNDIYFQVISETEDNNFLSGTYTKDNFFQYYDLANVVLDINEEEIPPTLEMDNEYKFTMMDVSADNWVNLVVEENFIPGNLQEFLNENKTNLSEKITSFAASANGSETLSYIYYLPLTNARDFRYYEINDLTLDKNNFSNYRREILSDEAVFDAKLRRFSRNDSDDNWCIVTYEIDGVVYTSSPIYLQIKSKPTKYETEVVRRTVENTKIQFTWDDFGITDNVRYFQVLRDASSTFLSGIFTTENTFTYYDLSNTTANINTETPPDLVLNEEYKFTLFGISNDNWINLTIENSFEFK